MTPKRQKRSKRKKSSKKSPVTLRVFFNASVILAGFHTPTGGSGTLLSLISEEKITGVISEIVAHEVIKRAGKIGFTKRRAAQKLQNLFERINPPPPKQLVEKYQSIVIDHGDAHVLAAATEAKAQFLVTLDKKHLLTLKQKVTQVKIVSPGELLTLLKEKSHVR